MPQTQHPSPANDAALLRTLLRDIAADADLTAFVPRLLPQLRAMSGASAAFCIAYATNEHFVDQMETSDLPDSMWLRDSIQQASMELDLPQALKTQYAAWQLLPIRIGDDLDALVGLIFSEPVKLDEEQTQGLEALLDGLAIVMRIARADAKHYKMAHNQNEFVRIVSHDLRSPLTSMQGFASMLESQMAGDLNEKQLHFVEKILTGVLQMTSLVENIQDAGRYDPETGFYEMERVPTDLIEIVKRIADNHIVPAEKQELTLIVNVDDDLPIVNVDATMIERAITNLVDNAIKYTPNGGKIEVGARRKDDDIVLTVTDNGFGISESNLRLLFQRHFRIRRVEHKRVKGSGLGLFIVRSVARWHGGDAFVHSREGEGSTFGFRIPLRGENLLGAAE
jgi:signal transduction histidine kinase